MSRMEMAVKPFLPSLILNKHRLEVLTAAEQTALSLWAVKTAYSFNYGSSASLRVPVEHLRQLGADPSNIPDGVGVFACIHPSLYNRTLDFAQAQFWPLNLPPGDGAKVTDSYKLFLRLGHLLLLVAYWPSKEDCLVYQHGIHQPLALRHQAVPIDMGMDFFQVGVHVLSVRDLFIASLGVGLEDRVSLINKLDDPVFLEAYGKTIFALYEYMTRLTRLARSSADAAYPTGPPGSS